jgi:serine/threonine protein kinase
MTAPKAVEAETTTLLAEASRELAGAYSLGDIIGSGLAGITVAARNLSTGRSVALKVAWNNSEARERVQRDVELTSRITHPNVLPVRRVATSDAFVIAEAPLMVGGSAGALLDGGVPVQYNIVLEILRSVGGALELAHSMGIAHGSLRPETILIDGNGTPMLTDFALTIPPVITSDVSRPSVIGTPAYTSIEQRHDDLKTDGRTDQYALAVIAYELLRGERTWRFNHEGMLEIDAIEVMLNRPIAPGVPVHAGMAIRRASSRDAGYRYASVGDFIRAFAGESQTGQVPSEQLYHEQILVDQRHSKLWLAIPALIVVAGGVWMQPSSRQAAISLFRGNWPFAKAEYNNENTTQGDAVRSGQREQTQTPPSNETPNTRAADSSRSPTNTRREGTQPTPNSERGGGGDPYPRTKAPPVSATPSSPRGAESQRIGQPKSEAAITGLTTGGGRSSDRTGESKDSRNPGSQTQSRAASISVTFAGPGRAIVIIDGQPRGVTPLVWQGSPGQHSITLGGVSFEPSSISLTATAGDTVRAAFTPRPRP